LAAYAESDASRILVALPASTEQVQAVVRLMRERIAIAIRWAEA